MSSPGLALDQCYVFFTSRNKRYCPQWGKRVFFFYLWEIERERERERDRERERERRERERERERERRDEGEKQIEAG